MSGLETTRERFHKDGWVLFERDQKILDWLEKAGPAALATRHEAENRHWLVCRDTWFVGVNVLKNDASGAVNGSGPLAGQAIDFIHKILGFADVALDHAQVSICYPGFPKPRAGESDAAFAYRRDRDAAHVDGLHATGPERLRKQREFQGFLLGIPITSANDRAAPLVVWRGSHKRIADFYAKALRQVPASDWHDVDLTDAYHDARRRVFETCERVLVPATPGQSYVLHPMLLHGVSPWRAGAVAPAKGRAILYFRPEIPRGEWRKFMPY